MTTRYLDLLNGNDSNNGSSFALRKKTMASAVSGLVSGDQVNIMASPDPTSMSQSATFTNGSDTVTLTTAVTANIDNCEAAWTPSTNVTATAQSARAQEGTNAASIAIASAFTTGLVAYSRTRTADGSDSISNRSSNMLGAGTLTLIQNASADDANILVSLPFTVYFHGIGYTSVYVGSNSFLTFGAGSNTTTPSASNPAIPGIQINGHDASYQRVYAGSEDSNATYRIRYEGASGTSGTPGSSTVFWEITFTAATPGVIKIDMGSNAASALGNSGCTDGSAYFATFANGTVNTGYTLTNVLPTYGAIDLSAYQQISFLICQTGLSTLASGVLLLKLCTDTAGATPVHTVTIPLLENSTWQTVVFDNAGALNSAIQSVALYAASDPATPTVFIDNIIACKASSSGDSLTHRSLISKGSGASSTEPWMMIRSINGTTIKLGAGSTAAIFATPANLFPYYYGSTATQTIYKREAIALTAALGGSVGGGVIFEGGWDTTAMSSQSSQTFLFQTDPTLNVLDYNTVSNLSVNKLYAVNAAHGLYNTQGCVVKEYGAIGCQVGWQPYQINASDLEAVDSAYRTFVHCGTAIQPQSSGAGAKIRVRADVMWGVIGAAASISSPYSYGAINDMAQNGYYLEFELRGADIQGFYAGLSNSFAGGGGSSFASMRFMGCSLKNCLRDWLYAGPTTCTVVNGTLTSQTPIQIQYTDYAEVNNNNDTTKHRWWPRQYSLYKGYWQSDSTTRHTASDFSWNFFIPTASSGYRDTSAGRNLCALSVAKIACVANEQRTVTLWFYRDNTATLMRLRVKGGQLAGIDNDVTTNMTAAINTWQQLTIQFTPTQKGVIEVLAECYGSSGSAGTYNAWVDDLGVS